MAPVYLITGGSRGIGSAVARLAAEQGAAVCVNYVSNADAAQSVVDDITSRGGQAMACQGDMAVEADIQRVFDECAAAFGPVTALVNNAGVLDLEGNLADFSSERISRIINLNVTGALICSREAVRRMSTDNGGQGWCDHQYLVDGCNPWQRRCVCRLRCIQRRYRRFDHWFGS